VQTTAIDRESGLIQLTTTWVSSDWPVCPVSETAAPHRMGAALTYARRYALFTLVGIAGEDDLDAPNRPDIQPSAGTAAPSQARKANGRADAIAVPQVAPQEPGARGRIMKAARPLLADESAAVRDRLLGEVAVLSSVEAAASWARDGIAAKNSLTAADAKRVEEAFAARLSGFSRSEIAASAAPEPAAAPAPEEPAPVAPGNDAPPGIDKSVLAVAEPRRFRNKEHLRFVAQQACLVCGRKHSDPHHLGFAQPRALGRKVSDEFVVPLCRTHHRAVHRVSDERTWWKQAGIDPVQIARQLWTNTRLNDGSINPGLQTGPAEPARQPPGGAVGKASA